MGKQQHIAALWGPMVAVDPDLHRIVADGPLHANFDDRIRAAFVLLERRIRDKADLLPTDYGVGLVTKAFGENSPLGAISTVKQENDGFRKLFEGLFQYYRNPVAHRPLYHGKEAAWSLFYVINHCLLLVEEAARAALDISNYVGPNEGQLLRRRDFRLDIDGDDESEIVILLDTGPTSDGSDFRSHLLPVVIDKTPQGYRRLPAERLAHGSLHGPLDVQALHVTNDQRPDLVLWWGAGQTSANVFIQRWADDRYLVVRRDVAELREPYRGPLEDAFVFHARNQVRFADIDGDGLVEVVQEMSPFWEDLRKLGYTKMLSQEQGMNHLCRVWKWDSARDRLVRQSENLVALVKTSEVTHRWEFVETVSDPNRLTEFSSEPVLPVKE